ncbi:sucrose-6-phosphate hydrolase [Lactobacillus sp. LL6]|uniref:sucrose-6-phosphate hydrolase n=1 Tax=Lactobacillus sp. LL6 TaxID=2596827 RepID=UPI001186DCF5|nr:sucrose-6-phosphate hydrolase [Lactobacillus sp. LL6]TSO25922.1 sucrose-6-phosphate hydrolase [Lactobacillus sp. LL6]
MEWTRKKRYLPYNEWDADTLLHLQSQASRSNYQMRYHLRPISGLVNDPNGFSYYNGEYHVFYQSYPFGAVHGLKSWVHFKSHDLVHWERQGLAIEPSFKGDSHGAYSGSAKQIGDKLFIMYTGNHRSKDWIRTPYQISAWMNKDGVVSDKEILFKNPSHITEHFRDPQIIEKDGTYYAILGAQDEQNKKGHIDVWKSQNLKDWEEIGFLNFTDEDMGYMIECPNLVQVDDKWVLIFCPQGLNKAVADYQNIYPNMYVIADDIDFENAKMINPSKLQNLDEGFDVYATQAFNAPNGKAYEISWVGLPDITYPTDDENWANCLSQVKELSIKDGKLIQKPVKAIESIRKSENKLTDKLIRNTTSGQYELKLTIAKNQSTTLHLAANKDLSESLILNIDTNDGKLVLDRSKGKKVAVDYGETRSCELNPNESVDLDIFIDHSLIEIFVNHGEHVLTGRFFTNPENQKISFDKDIDFTGKFWEMETIF